MANFEEVKLGSSKPMIATQQEMVENRVPIPYRDQCAHLLIPLNKCRSKELYLPWKCEAERHTYEKCEYELVMERMLRCRRSASWRRGRSSRPSWAKAKGARSRSSHRLLTLDPFLKVSFLFIFHGLLCCF